MHAILPHLAGHIAIVVAQVLTNVDYSKEDVALMINAVVSWCVEQILIAYVEVVFRRLKNAVIGKVINLEFV